MDTGDLGEVVHSVLGGAGPPLKEQALGVLLDSLISRDAQVEAVACSAFCQLHRICNLIWRRRIWLQSSMLQVLDSLSALSARRAQDYNELYVGLHLMMVQKLQLVPECSSQMFCSGACRPANRTPVLGQLRWLSMSLQAQFEALILVLGDINGSRPA